MTVLVEISIPSDSFIVGEVLGTPGVQIELLACIPVGRGPVPYCWLTGADDVTMFERSVRSDPRITSLTALDGTDTKSLYRIKWAEGVDGLISAFREHGLIVEQATGTANEWTFQLRAPKQAALDAFHQEPRIRDTDLSIQNVTHSPGENVADSQLLTSKQHEAVLLAVEQGYFQVPREISLTELAEEVGISRQAFTRRLHRGLHNLLTVWL